MSKMTLSKKVRALSDGHLTSMVTEILLWHESGVLIGDDLRIFAKEVVSEVGLDPDGILQTVEAFVLREAARRYADAHIEKEP